MDHPEGKLCPACKNDIGMMAVIEAPLPNMMKCGHCDAPVIYAPVPWRVLGVAMTVFMILLAGLLLADLYWPISLGIMLVMAVAFEVGIAAYLRSNCILQRRAQ